jgi:hypothetical protein
VQLIYSFQNGVDLPEKQGFILLIPDGPLPDFRGIIQRMQLVNGLIEVVPDRIQFLFHGKHICQKVINGSVPVFYIHRPGEDDPPYIITQSAAGCILTQVLQLSIFFFCKPDGEPFVSHIFLLFHIAFI